MAEEGRRQLAAEIRQVLARREQALACRRQEAVASCHPKQQPLQKT